jgi:hypothetical protein
MKCSALLPQVALVLAVAYACSDSTPAVSDALVANSQRVNVVGKQPPPPVTVVIAVAISSQPASAVFTGVFFSNGSILDDGSGVNASDGMAWLRFDNQQPGLGGTTSANARFMVKAGSLPTGNGTLTFDIPGGTESFRIVSVQNFTFVPECGAPEPGLPPSPCASIQFTAEEVGGGTCDPNAAFDPDCHHGNLIASDKSSCLVSDGEGGFYFKEGCQFPPFPDSGEG